jgi:hypothetical protein
LVGETNYYASTVLVYFLLIIFVFNYLDNFKTNSLLDRFNMRSKNQLHFLSVKLTTVQKGVTYCAIKIFNHLPSDIFELQESKMLVKSALRNFSLLMYFILWKNF